LILIEVPSVDRRDLQFTAERWLDLRGDVTVGLGAGGMPTLSRPGWSNHYVGHGVGAMFMLQRGVRPDYCIFCKPRYTVSWEEVGLTWFDLMGIDGDLRRWYGSLMFTNEGDTHLRLRRLVSRAFTLRSAVDGHKDHRTQTMWKAAMRPMRLA